MRNRKLLIAGAASLALSIGITSAAHAAVFQGQSLVMSAQSGKQDKKKAGPIKGLVTDVITTYTNSPPSAPDRYATNTKLYFPTDFRFNAAGLPQCANTPSFAGGTTANALALCGPAKVSSFGSANIEGAIPGVTAVVTAFNGQPSGGNPTLLLHSQSSAGPSLVLVGTLRNSDVGGFGKMLDVPVDLGPLQGTEAITDFKVGIPRVKLPFAKSQKKAFAKKRAKCKKVRSKGKRGKCLKNVNAKEKKVKQRSYIMASCRTGKWSFQAISTYNTGGPTTAPASLGCKQLKPKKKK